MKIPALLALAFALLGSSGAYATLGNYPSNGANYMRFTAEQPPLMPMPQKVDWKGKCIAFDSVSVKLDGCGKDASSEQMQFLLGELKDYLASHNCQLGSGKAALRLSFQISAVPLADVPEDKQEEAYSLNIDAKGNACICARNSHGLYYGYQTLRQLLIRRQDKTTLPICSITDYPDYPIRGFMNDVGRNYLPVALIKKEMDAMVRAKMNYYHIHLTDAPAWRMQSKIYPQLTKAENQERFPGKFYSQKDFVDLLRYAALRNIRIIPEIDMPGHSAAFRKALGVEHMEAPKAVEAMEKLIAELCALVPAEQMPYLHIGTDEVRGAAEQVSGETIKRYFAAVEKAGRRAIRWQPGQHQGDEYKPLEQIWSGRQRSKPSSGAEYIDSQENYTNHLDNFEAAMTYFFRLPCPYQGAKGLGGIVCSWPDLPMNDSAAHLTQSCNFVSIAVGGEGLWNSALKFDEARTESGNVYPIDAAYLPYFSNLPVQGDPLLKKFASFEDRLVALRDRFDWNSPYNYVRQANIPWKIIGPFPNGGKTETSFSPEEMLKSGKPESSYKGPDGKDYPVSEQSYSGATIIFKHYCDYPTLFNGGKMGAHPGQDSTYYAYSYIYSPKAQEVPFWISGQTWATSDWRNGPASVPGKWFHADTSFWVNGKKIAPPAWKPPNKGDIHVDHNYIERKATPVQLKKGWNLVLVKAPCNKSSRRWMFTFVPVKPLEKSEFPNVREYPGLKFSVDPTAGKKKKS